MPILKVVKIPDDFTAFYRFWIEIFYLAG